MKKGRDFESHPMNITRLIRLAKGLIEIPTVNPPGENYEKMADFLERECRGIGLSVKRHVTPEKILRKYGIRSGSRRISVVADWDVGAKKTFHVNSHYDVVPATDKWDTDPFRAVVRGNRIYGRGSEDMKGNIVSVLAAVEALKKSGARPGMNIQLSFTPDEETGGRTGLGYLVRENLVKADYAMSEGYPGNHVSVGNKGVLWAEVLVRGKSCHASAPHKGVNAFEKMTALAVKLEKLKKRVIARKTRYQMRDDVSRHATFVMGGVLEGGVKVNVVPGEAKFSIDRRLIPEESAAEAKKEIESVIRRFNKIHKDSKAIIKYFSMEEPAMTRYDAKFFKVVSDSIKAATGKKAEFRVMSGATDMRYFMWKGVPSLGYSASGGEKWHGDNEYVRVDSLVSTARVFELVMRNLE